MCLPAGFVHLWHVSSRSGLVRRAPDALAPVRCLRAHDTGVLALDWSWAVAAHLVSGGMDNLVKVWDAHDTRGPLFYVPGEKPSPF